MRFMMSLVCVLCFAGGALAQQEPAPRHAPEARERGPAGMMAKLGLDEKQKADIAGLRTEMEKAMVGIQSKIKIARIDIKSLVMAESPDKSAIEGKMKEVSDLQYQAKKLTVDHLFSVYGLLTAEQKKTFREHMMTRLSGGMERMGGWQGGHRGMPGGEDSH